MSFQRVSYTFFALFFMDFSIPVVILSRTIRYCFKQQLKYFGSKFV